MFFPILVFIVALGIASVAAWFSVIGLMAIFAASALPVAIMAGALEVGKLVSASWVYRNWKRAPFLLKSYLTFAVIVLMFITSMGIFGFLSRAHLEQASEGQQNLARVERIETDIARFEETITRTEVKIEKLENEVSTDTDGIQEQIDAEQERMDKAYDRIQPAIDEQLAIINNEQKGAEEQVKSYLSQIEKIDASLENLRQYAENNEIEKLQALVGVRVDGSYGSRTARAVEVFRENQQNEKLRLIAIVEDIRKSVNNDVVEEARNEIKRLREIANRDIEKSQSTIDRLRLQLDQAAEIDNTVEIEELLTKVRDSESQVEVLLDEKFELETEIRKLEAEVGPIKYIAELIYGDTERSTIDDAVRWLIIVFIFVFDPLAVLLLIAANFSFQNRHNYDNRQEEIFDALFSKKTVDKDEEKSDNEDDSNETETGIDDEGNIDDIEAVTPVEESKEPEKVEEPVSSVSSEEEKVLRENKVANLESVLKNASPEALKIVKRELEREINTQQEKRSGWLDDIGK